MDSSASTKGQRQGGSHGRRLTLHITIGMLMVAVAAAGYMFLGPTSGTAIGDHDRRANLTANISVATPVITTTLTMESQMVGVDGIDTMRAEMQEITDQVNRILIQPQTPTPPIYSPSPVPGTAISSGHG